MNERRVELLAPAGNLEGFYGAIHAGADAVYLGGSRFGARAYADNFNTEELISCIRYAHLWGRKVYLTVNTLVKEAELQDLHDYLSPYYEAGLDGVIVQDIGVLAFVREHFPGMEIHASTQMTLTGEYGAALLRDMGVCRIVPARELSLKEISGIKQNTGLDMECFIHGAMCYCYSGQCLFSSILGGRSGNRGRCAQPCRLPYEVKTEKGKTGECYPLSLKDMCTIEHIPELIESGIDSFKIEGRMKKPEYTAGVTSIYRKYIDRYYKHMNKYDRDSYQKNEKSISKSAFKIDPADAKALSCLYIRSERQDGYYYKHNGKDMITLDSPAYSGSDEALLESIRREYLEQKPKMPIAIYAYFQTGQNASLTFVLDEISITVEGDPISVASKQPITEENIEKQIRKLGDSVFEAETIEIAASRDAFYPLRAINELRRKAVTGLENALIEKNGFPVYRERAVLSVDEEHAVKKSSSLSLQSLPDKNVKCHKNRGCISLSIRKKEQLDAVLDSLGHFIKNRNTDANDEKRLQQEADASCRFARVYIDSDLLLEDAGEVLAQCRVLSEKCEVVMALPYILRERDYSAAEKMLFPLLTEQHTPFSGVLVRSIEEMGMIKKVQYPGKIYTDAGFYIWNQKTLQEWTDSMTGFAGFCMPFELRGSEQKSLLGTDVSCEKVVYGRIPMMITANCVAKTTTGCQKNVGERRAEIVDRYHKTFPVELNCAHCMNIIYNSVPLSLHGELLKWKDAVDFRLDFTVETEHETKEIILYFMQLCESGYADSKRKPPYQDYTTGHEKRGVE